MLHWYFDFIQKFFAPTLGKVMRCKENAYCKVNTTMKCIQCKKHYSKNVSKRLIMEFHFIFLFDASLHSDLF